MAKIKYENVSLKSRLDNTLNLLDRMEVICNIISRICIQAEIKFTIILCLQTIRDSLSQDSREY